MSARARATAVTIAAILVGALIAPATFAGAAAPEPNGDVVRAWNDLALDSIRVTKGSDATAARVYAMTNVAMYDAVNGLRAKKDRRTPAVVAPNGTAKGDAAVAAARAAHDVLVGLYPARQGQFDSRLATDVGAAPANDQTEKGRMWGANVAAAVLAARANDGTNPAALPPFAIADPARYKGGPPPDTSTLDYAAAFNTVKILGDSRNVDQAKTDTFWFWSLGAGSDQPPGAWVQVAELVSASRHLTLTDTTRLLALETIAMSDTVAPTNVTKQTYNRIRPTFAIHDAESDSNPFTVDDDGWTARSPSAGSPGEYWSGHSAFSAAASTTLAGFFCDDRADFTLTTDVQTGALQANAPRTFSSFSGAANEAGMSRIYGGLHFPYSNQAGLAAGGDIADEVLGHALLLQGQPTHHGACPL